MSGRHIGRLLLRYIPSTLLVAAVWGVAAVVFGVNMHLPSAITAIVGVALADAWQRVCDRDGMPHFWERDRDH